jgi:hypothetical protein
MRYHHDKGNAGSGLLRTNLENDESILSTRQLATDSALGTPIRNGTRRVYEDAICISFLAKKGQHSIFASLGNMKVFRGTSDKELASRFSE